MRLRLRTRFPPLLHTAAAGPQATGDDADLGRKRTAPEADLSTHLAPSRAPAKRARLVADAQVASAGSPLSVSALPAPGSSALRASADASDFEEDAQTTPTPASRRSARGPAVYATPKRSTLASSVAPATPSLFAKMFKYAREGNVLDLAIGRGADGVRVRLSVSQVEPASPSLPRVLLFFHNSASTNTRALQQNSSCTMSSTEDPQAVLRGQSLHRILRVKALFGMDKERPALDQRYDICVEHLPLGAGPIVESMLHERSGMPVGEFEYTCVTLTNWPSPTNPNPEDAYGNWVHPSGEYILCSHNYARKDDHFRSEPRMFWSDIMAESYRRAAPAPNRRGLRCIWRSPVANQDTRNIIERIISSHRPGSPFIDVHPGEDQFYALLASDNGRGSCLMLSDYPELFGRKLNVVKRHKRLSDECCFGGYSAMR
ncbi:hypothetical protein CDD80_5131 [Ophiocordyceps camponoti-rufipedis]|uniref:Uncharacterized protein n=1 Tax=Ophiocordyceps camponoti-rufipedis TaxID=2004952 RepID=A0A2C5YX09_9HYPO|nr:hypothetical protein CDD80_5131 [Ophiocordyceps camponoti-rufipedis]